MTTTVNEQQTNLLHKLIGSKVTIRLNDGSDYVGKMTALDGFLNVSLEQTRQFVNGEAKVEYGDVILRGNNGNSIPLTIVLFISPCANIPFKIVKTETEE